MESCDTNILVYYLNVDCAEHQAAARYMERQFHNSSFAICELVLIELYTLLRNPNVFTAPLSQKKALEITLQFRSHPKWYLLDYPGDLMDRVWALLKQKDSSRHAIFDLRLAQTLEHHGVKRLATRNVKDFVGSELELFDPIQQL